MHLCILTLQPKMALRNTLMPMASVNGIDYV